MSNRTVKRSSKKSPAVRRAQQQVAEIRKEVARAFSGLKGIAKELRSANPGSKGQEDTAETWLADLIEDAIRDFRDPVRILRHAETYNPQDDLDASIEADRAGEERWAAKEGAVREAFAANPVLTRVDVRRVLARFNPEPWIVDTWLLGLLESGFLEDVPDTGTFCAFRVRLGPAAKAA